MKEQVILREREKINTLYDLRHRDENSVLIEHLAFYGYQEEASFLEKNPNFLNENFLNENFLNENFLNEQAKNT